MSAAMDPKPTAPHMPASFHERLLALRDELARGTQPERDLRDSGLEAVSDNLGGLDEESRGVLDEALAPLKPVLARILRTARQRKELDSGSWRDLRILVRRLTAAFAFLREGGHSRHQRVARLTVSYQRVDLSAVTTTLAEPFRELAQQCGIAINCEIAPNVEAEVDPHKIARVLLNLFFNAILYTPQGGTIHCKLRTESYDEYIIFEVVDSGSPLPPGSAERIFERGRQMERSIFPVLEGQPWGMATSRDFIEFHGGVLGLRRPPANAGCIIKARFPRRAPLPLNIPAPPPDLVDTMARLAREVADYAREELEAEANLGATAEENGRARVLIVDDSRAVQRVLARALGEDHVIASTFTGVEGLREALRHPPSLIIADLHMPEMDGEAMIRALRSHGELTETPILVLTGSDDREQAARLLQNGAQDLLTKPFSVAEVRARVNNLLQARRTQQVLNETIGRHESDLLSLAMQVAQQHEELQAAVEDVRAAREMAESSSNVKSNFLRMMSHELKTPIAAMQLQMFMLRQHLGSGISPAVQDTLEGLSRSADRLLNLVDTSLEWARVESGRCKVTPEPVELLGLVAEVADQSARFAKRRKVHLTVSSASPPERPPWVYNDPRIVRLVVANLINYAVQVTRTGVVEVEVVEDLEGGGEVRVSDGAPPIPKEHRHTIFSPFQGDLDLRWSAGAGSGLGLYVIRSIARALGGDVELRDSDEMGNTFSFAVPSLNTVHEEEARAAHPGG